MRHIKENISNLLFIAFGTVSIVSNAFLWPATLPLEPTLLILLAAGTIGVFLHRWVSGSRGEALTSLPRVGNYELRHARFYEGNQERDEKAHYEFIVLINGKRRFLELPERAVQKRVTGNTGSPGRLVHQLIVGEPEYILETVVVMYHPLLGRH